jgi:hypothetical protein
MGDTHLDGRTEKATAAGVARCCLGRDAAGERAAEEAAARWPLHAGRVEEAERRA